MAAASSSSASFIGDHAIGNLQNTSVVANGSVPGRSIHSGAYTSASQTNGSISGLRSPIKPSHPKNKPFTIATPLPSFLYLLKA